MKQEGQITVVIPTYKCPDALELCIRSLLEGQVYKNEILVVVDGHYDINKEVLDKHKANISLLNLTTNVGLCKGTNLGVYNAKHDIILVINDDNVAPRNWDVKLLQDYHDGSVLTPNQIEPKFSMFKQFHIEDLGRDPKTFNLKAFQDRADEISQEAVEFSGGTLPFLISKRDYLKVGGWDENYPMGLTADWEFFFKLQLVGVRMLRTYNVHFYHFESLTTRQDPVKSQERDRNQLRASQYFYYKWGGQLHNTEENVKILVQ